MHTIFCIDERTAEGIYAVKFAVELAQKMDARLIVGVAKSPRKSLVTAGDRSVEGDADQGEHKLSFFTRMRR